MPHILLILGTTYLKLNNIQLDFGKTTCFAGMKQTTKVRSKNSFVIEPNSEVMVSGTLSKDIRIGMQGVCTGHAEVLNKGLFVAKSIVTCMRDHVVPVKILNPGNNMIHVNKGTILCSFKLCDNSVDIIPVGQLSCANINVQSANMFQSSSADGSLKTDPEFEKFRTYFDIDSEQSVDNANKLLRCLYVNKDVFITDESPELGRTDLVQHQIHLKPDAVPKYQRPYSLSS